jgi:hypothetical protein
MGQSWLPEPPPMDDRDVIEAHELQRRRTLAAFLWGTQTARARHAEAGQGLLIGAVLAILIALVIGVGALVDVSRHRSQRSAAESQTAAPISGHEAASTVAS